MFRRPKLCSLHGDRDAISQEVTREVLSVLSTGAARGLTLRASLEEAAQLEIARLDKLPDVRAEKTRLDDWRALASRLDALDDPALLETGTGLIDRYVRDVEARFSWPVYLLASRIVPRLLVWILSPAVPFVRFSWIRDLCRRFKVFGPIEQLKACAARGTLVFTPTHSSNLDSVVMAWALHVSGLQATAYGAGKNLFINRILGFFLRNLGAYRVDRRIAHTLYKLVLKQYSIALLVRGYHSLFFPGGTRSRSGGIESHLKLGLLGTVPDAYRRNVLAGRPARRLYVVPVTINYAVVLEAASLVAEHLAGVGHRETEDDSTTDSTVFGFVRRVMGLDGAVVVRFGCPMDPFGNRVDAVGTSLDDAARPIDLARLASLSAPATGAHEGNPARELARKLGEAYVELTELMPTQLVARVVLDLGARMAGPTDLAPASVEIPAQAVLADLARWQRWLAFNRPGDPTSDTHWTRATAQILDDALRAFLAFHGDGLVRRRDDRLVVGNAALLGFYANRTSQWSGPFARAQSASSETGSGTR